MDLVTQKKLFAKVYVIRIQIPSAIFYRKNYANHRSMRSYISLRHRLPQFEEIFGRFVESLPAGFNYCLESRNPNYLNKRYFDFLNGQGLHHVFLQGYYMPSIFDLYRKHREQIKDSGDTG